MTALAIVRERREVVGGRLRTALLQVVTRRAAPYGFAVIRIGFGVVTLVLLVLNGRSADRLWGPSGPFDLELDRHYLALSGSFSLFALSGASWWTTGLLALTAATAGAFMLGWHTRLACPMLALLVFSLQERNPYITDGGDNLLRILLVYLIFADCGARWSLDARRQQPPDPGSVRWQLGSVLHNAALALVVFQVCVVYETAGLAKVQGPKWQDGTAIYYVLRDAQFATWPGISRLVSQDAVLVNLLTWGTVLLQVAFPLLLLRTWTRRAALAATTSFHLGIGLLMGLPLFSATMILSEAVLVSDRAWEALGRAVGRTIRSGRAGPPGVPDLPAALSRPERTPESTSAGTRPGGTAAGSLSRLS